MNIRLLLAWLQSPQKSNEWCKQNTCYNHSVGKCTLINVNAVAIRNNPFVLTASSLDCGQWETSNNCTKIDYINTCMLTHIFRILKVMNPHPEMLQWQLSHWEGAPESVTSLMEVQMI